MHRRPGPPDGQRLRLPDARGGQHRDARPLRAARASSPPARTASTRSATSTASSAAGTRSSTTRSYLRAAAGRGPAAHDRRRRRPVTAAPRTVTFHDSCYLARYNDVVAAAARRPRRRARARARRDGAQRQARRSAAAPAAAGCGWRRRAARGSTPSGPARRSRPAPATVATDCPFCMTMMRDGLAVGRGATRPASSAPSTSPSSSPRRSTRPARAVASCRCSSDLDPAGCGLPPDRRAARAARRGPPDRPRAGRAAGRRDRPDGRVPVGPQGAPGDPGHPRPALPGRVRRPRCRPAHDLPRDRGAERCLRHDRADPGRPRARRAADHPGRDATSRRRAGCPTWPRDGRSSRSP